MSGVNRITLIGFLGKDPITSQVGEATVTKFSIATSNSWKDKSGNKQERTEWFNIEAWGGLGKVCIDYLQKGKQVYIEGRIQTDKWQDKEGHDRYTVKVVASTMQMLGSKGDSPQSEPVPQEVAGLDDIPF